MAILVLVIAAAVFTTLFFAAKKAPHPCRLLAPSALAVCACAVCLSATTYAWFSATSTSNVATIQAATYDVTVNGYETTNGVYTVTLDGTPHSITIRPATDSTASVGYCKVELTKDSVTETYYTPQIISGEFAFAVSGFDGTLTITRQWGTCTATDSIIDSTHSIPYGTATSDLFMIPEPPETPEPPEEDSSETTYPVENDTVDPATTPVTQATPPATEPPPAPVVPESLPETEPVTPE